MHGNQISKSTLLLAVDELCRRWSDCYYFPSYEIMMDELRDYRFYADDMLHPSPVAVSYLWECFTECYFSKETDRIKIERLKEKFPYFDLQKELEQCQARLKI